ncbi:MAG: phosphomethylpyrimidine synthase ThiC [Thermodesulfovibrionales bacterium]|nr:phosphomethylpyrimidine synthase ThiC [Thermodesulfovibrionales bacterium]
MTQIERARSGEITPEMEKVSQDECIDEILLKEYVASGKVIIPANKRRKARVTGIGKGLRTKVNVSIGTSTDIIDIPMEIEKAKIAERCGADTLMDLSVGGNISKIRRALMDTVELPIGTVPLYEAFAMAIEKYGAAVRMPVEVLFDVIEKQCEEGVAFMAIHCGINRRTLEMLRRQNYRYGGLVSKGGSYMVAWMEYNNKENPLYEYFDKVVEILKKHDVVLSLGNGFRAGAVHDSTDRVQIQELIINCELAEAGREMGCQTMVEGPGHIPINEIEANIIMQKKMSGEAPFYMLGPIVTDIAPGYDHITSAIGAALASAYGADFICYVTPAEHLGLPFPEDVREGLIAARIAAHIGDMIKLKRMERDKLMAKARRDMKWEEQFLLAIDPERAREIKSKRGHVDHGCTMCGRFCANDILKGMFQRDMEGSDKK